MLINKNLKMMMIKLQINKFLYQHLFHVEVMIININFKIRKLVLTKMDI